MTTSISDVIQPPLAFLLQFVCMHLTFTKKGATLRKVYYALIVISCKSVFEDEESGEGGVHVSV